MSQRRDPKPTNMQTLRQQRAFLFAFVYEMIARAYGRDAPMDLRVQHVRREYIAAARADDAQRQRRLAS